MTGLLLNGLRGKGTKIFLISKFSAYKVIKITRISLVWGGNVGENA